MTGTPDPAHQDPPGRDRVLMVTPYAPYRDGIAAYAVQEVRRMRADGVDLEVLSPLPSAAHHHLALGGVRGITALTARARRYDRVIIQFSPEMMFGACRTPLQRVAVWGGIEALARVTRLEIRLHEIEYGPLERNPAERALAARALRAAARLSVHTRREVEALVERLGLTAADVTLVDHGASFVAASTVTRQEARADLGLPDDEHVFLAIGFIQDHKGFDRAAEAFGRAGLDRASFHIVGSVRVDHPDLVDYARRLEAQCRAIPGVTLHRGYVSDEAFDRWIIAADTVVLPYREIWSSGVLERAKLHRTPIIATDVGGLTDQAPEGAVFFTDTESMVQAFKARVAADGPRPDGGGGAGAPAGTAASDWDVGAEVDRVAVETMIRSRARSRQLTGDPASTAGSTASAAGASAVDPLVAIGSVNRPEATSARPGVSHLKQVLRRLMNWEIAPVATQVDAVRRATMDAIGELEARVAALEAREPSHGTAAAAGAAGPGETGSGKTGSAKTGSAKTGSGQTGSGNTLPDG
ncbi:MAG: glycosyltransferase family 4 protein [Acidimicrobiales bacterium]